MKKSIAVLFAAAVMGSAGLLHAGEDVGPDQVVKLVQSGTIKSFDQLNAAAMAKHPGATLSETELEQEFGRYVYKVELRDQAGLKWDVEVDATTGEVIRDRQDD